AWLAAAAAAALAGILGCARAAMAEASADVAVAGEAKDPVVDGARRMIHEGRRTFRFDTFGDEAFWTDTLRLNAAVEKVPPRTALAVGLKVDLDALPPAIVNALKAGKVNLDDPAVTAALLRLDAVVGVKGAVDAQNHVTRLGITCALCHSTVDDALTTGIGHRLDGWPNRDLNVGAIINAAPDHSVLTNLLGVDDATLGKVLSAWGPGRFDAEVTLDGKAFRPDGKTGAVLIPAAFGLAGVNLATYTGWGTVTYWNAFVANLEMHGQGTFRDPRLDDASKFPVAAKAGFGHVTHNPDLVSSGLPALHYYQLALKAPSPPAGSFDPAAAKRGEAIFDGPGRCASCHVPPTYSEPGYNLHAPSEICTDSFTADRSPTGMYRTAPLRGLWARSKGGYYHDGRYPDLLSVVQHYNSCMNLGLSSGQMGDLVQFLKSR
ncbi:MAG: hypothetical protein ACXVQZ_09325, partial [Gaiellaceae bacterium]